jgi:hypothetical protein
LLPWFARCLEFGRGRSHHADQDRGLVLEFAQQRIDPFGPLLPLGNQRLLIDRDRDVHVERDTGVHRGDQCGELAR